MTDKELYNPDEFLLDNIKSYHYEVMDQGHHVWMAFYLADGKTGHLNIFLNNGKINTRYEEWETLDKLPQGHTRKDLDIL